MNRPAKLERKKKSSEASSSSSSSFLCSSSSLTKKKKKKKSNSKASPRNPLKDLNSIPIPFHPRISSESRRGGCFSFFTSNSSKPHPRTPRSAPPPNSTIQLKKPSKPCSENPRFQRSSDLSKPKRNGRRTISKDPILGGGHSSKGQNPKPEMSLCSSSQLSFRGFTLESRSNDPILGTGNENPNPSIEFEAELENVGSFWGEMLPVFCLNSTPEKKITGLSPELGLQTRETEKNLSTTPNSNNTPPIQASISPEVACGSNLDPVPECFAAGHVISGINDKRKCRPRGILTVGDECRFSDGTRISSIVPPVAEASIQWLSSPSENVFDSSTSEFNEASVKWFVSPNDVEKSDLVESEISPMGIRDSSDHGFWRFSPTNSNTSRSPKLGGLLGYSSPDFETTPSSGNDIRGTPTSGSSISPFSAIVKRATASSLGFRVFKPHEERGGNRYDSAMESTPLSGDFWSEVNCTSTPSPYSKSRKKGILSPFKLDSVSEVFGSMRLSPKQDANNLSPPLPALSFQFGCPGTPSNSNDLNYFKIPSKELDSEDKDILSSELRISWRDGLVSRIFEMGELDCCKWLSDDEENANYLGEEKVESELDLKNKSLILKEENERNISGGFGSFEFPFGEIGVQKNEGCLIFSEDSDWTLFLQEPFI